MIGAVCVCVGKGSKYPDRSVSGRIPTPLSCSVTLGLKQRREGNILIFCAQCKFFILENL